APAAETRKERKKACSPGYGWEVFGRHGLPAGLARLCSLLPVFSWTTGIARASPAREYSPTIGSPSRRGGRHDASSASHFPRRRAGLDAHARQQTAWARPAFALQAAGEP